MLDPGIAIRYLSKVEELDRTGSIPSVDVPSLAIQPIGSHVVNRAEKLSEDIQALPVLPPLPEYSDPMPRELDVHLGADVTVEIVGRLLRRIDLDPNKPCPAITVYAVSNNFALDAAFEVTLSQKDPEHTINVEDTDELQFWLLNPKQGVTYGLRRKG